jgi:orotate phosphoribosyltransferase
MEAYKAEFIEFIARVGALRFGEFTTKSGRRTPFFVNFGRFDTGALARRLGEFYATAIQDRLAGQFDLLFGPAYKGIPLATATAIALAERHGVDAPFAFNRKEAKDHGEGGTIVGRVPTDGDRVLLVDDVVTAGTSTRESAALLRAVADVRLAGLIVAVDRQERGAGEASALEEIGRELGLKTVAIVTLNEIVTWLHGRPIDGRVLLDDAMLEKIDAYRALYGAASANGGPA